MEEAANTDLVAVGARIKQARTESGLTQDELSDLVGVGLRQIQYYEAGESNPYRTLRRIAEATGRNIGWLLHGDPATAVDEGAVEAVASLHDLLAKLSATVDEMADRTAAALEELQHEMTELSARIPPAAGRRRKAQ